MANDEVVIDLQNYKDRVGTRVVPGRYRVRVEDAELDKTKAGDPMINLWLVVVKGDFEGATVIDRLLPSHPRALFRVVGFMQAIGLQTPKKRVKLNVSSFIGKQLDVDIEDGEPYNGRVKSEIRGYNRIEKGSEVVSDLPEDPIDPLDLPGDLEEFDEEIEREIAQAPEPAPASKAATSLKEQVAARQAAQQEAADGQPDPEVTGLPDGPDDEDGEFEAVDLDNLDLG